MSEKTIFSLMNEEQKLEYSLHYKMYELLVKETIETVMEVHFQVQVGMEYTFRTNLFDFTNGNKDISLSVILDIHEILLIEPMDIEDDNDAEVFVNEFSDLSFLIETLATEITNEKLGYGSILKGEAK
jgi:hypothetical protein